MVALTRLLNPRHWASHNRLRANCSRNYFKKSQGYCFSGPKLYSALIWSFSLLFNQNKHLVRNYYRYCTTPCQWRWGRKSCRKLRRPLPSFLHISRRMSSDYIGSPYRFPVSSVASSGFFDQVIRPSRQRTYLPRGACPDLAHIKSRHLIHLGLYHVLKRMLHTLKLCRHN